MFNLEAEKREQWHCKDGERKWQKSCSGRGGEERSCDQAVWQAYQKHTGVFTYNGTAHLYTAL